MPRSTVIAVGAFALIGFCALRAVARGYVPLDDVAIIEARARDVFGGPLPLLGSVSSASQGGGTVHHPGPLLFDLLAVPVRLLPKGTGVAVGVAAINAVAVATIAWAARRLLGGDGAVVVVASTAALMWSLGSEALYEAWQPIVVLLPFLLALVAAWGWGSGRDELALPAVVAMSLAIQTHGSYLLIGPGVIAAAIACRVAVHRRMPLRRRQLVVAGGAGVVVWLQPIADQLGASHNMSNIVSRATGDGVADGIGLGDGIRAAAMVLVKPPFWTRPGVTSSLPSGGGFVRTEHGRTFDPDWIVLPLAVAGLVALLAVLGVVVVLARRRSDHVLVAGGVVGAAAVIGGVVTLAGLPIDDFGFSAHKARWLWPMGTFLTAYLLLSLLRFDVVPNRRQASTSVAVLGAVALAATVPTSYQLLSPQHYLVGQQATARQLRDAAGSLEGLGVVFLDTSHRPFPDPYNDTLAAELVRRDIEFRVAGDYVVGQYGDERRLEPDDGADVTVRVLVGTAALSPPPDAEIVAVFEESPVPVALAVMPFAAPNG